MTMNPVEQSALERAEDAAITLLVGLYGEYLKRPPLNLKPDNFARLKVGELADRAVDIARAGGQ
jgi:hypothetical protein